jgi:hypothetical protein
MLFYLISDKELSDGCTISIPRNMVLFQEFSSAEEERRESGYSTVYKVIIDIKIHDPLMFSQTQHVYVPMKNGRFPDHSSENGLFKFELMEKITNIEESRDIFSTVALLEQIRQFGFDAVFVFNNYKREIIVINQCLGKIIGITTEEKS